MAGFSLEFALLNPSGFFFYSVYSVGGSVDPYLGTGTVKYNDLVFALHAFALASVQLVQIWMYDRGVQKDINRFIVAFLIFLYLCSFTTYIFEIADHPIKNLNWDTFLVMGYCKAAISFVKYVPQVYLNYSRKSTVGWSLANVILDFTGGFLSFMQIWINAVALGEPVFTGDAFNLVKFILSCMSILFDSIFLFQHYVLYRDSWNKPLEKSDEVEESAAAEAEKEDYLTFNRVDNN